MRDALHSGDSDVCIVLHPPRKKVVEYTGPILKALLGDVMSQERVD